MLRDSLISMRGVRHTTLHNAIPGESGSEPSIDCSRVSLDACLDLSAPPEDHYYWGLIRRRVL